MDEGTKFDMSRDILLDYLKELKDKPLNIAIRVYGSKGGACEDTELIFPFVKAKDINFDDLAKILQGLGPIGQNTPIAYSFTKAEGDFINKEGENNYIVLLTDGIETCRGDPCKVAEEIFASSARIKVNTVGIKIDEKGLAELNCIVKPSGSLVLNAETASELLSSLKKVVEVGYQSNLRIKIVDKNGKNLYWGWDYNCPDEDIPCKLAAVQSPAGWWMCKFLPGHYIFTIENWWGDEKKFEVDLCEDKVEEIVVTFDRGDIAEYQYKPYGVIHTNVIDNEYENEKFLIFLCMNEKCKRDNLKNFIGGGSFQNFCGGRTMTWEDVTQFAEFIAPPGTHEVCVYNYKRDEALLTGD